MSAVTIVPDRALLQAPASVDYSRFAWGEAAEARWYLRWKYAVEWLASLMLLLLALPVLVLAAVLIKLTSRGPVLYTQTRLGRRGRPYTMYKLRTMLHNCERDTGPVWATGRDPRITWIGRFLRRTHLDEFPQLWNVLRGEMSLVGPRPERPHFAVPLANVLPAYWQRLLLRPGVTGLAQVQLPADTDLASVRRKLAYDLYYVARFNLWLDVRIILGTVLNVIGVSYDLVRTLLRIPGGHTVEEAYLASQGTAAAAPAEAEPAYRYEDNQVPQSPAPAR